jgi:hypothetical protein
MPNCDFFAADADFDLVLNHVFDSGDFLVYEAYSPYEQQLLQFRTVDEVRDRYPSMGRCTGSGPSVLLQLLVPDSGSLVFEHITLDPRRCSGATFRYRASGWGLVQLQLGGMGPKGLVRSHTNHNSLARALKWEGTYREILGPAAAWDWSKIESTSRRFNRFLSRVAVRKDGSSPVLPAASRLRTVQ